MVRSLCRIFGGRAKAQHLLLIQHKRSSKCQIYSYHPQTVEFRTVKYSTLLLPSFCREILNLTIHLVTALILDLSHTQGSSESMMYQPLQGHEAPQSTLLQLRSSLCTSLDLKNRSLVRFSAIAELGVCDSPAPNDGVTDAILMTEDPPTLVYSPTDDCSAAQLNYPHSTPRSYPITWYCHKCHSGNSIAVNVQCYHCSHPKCHYCTEE